MNNDFNKALEMARDVYQAALTAADLRGLRLMELHLEPEKWHMTVLAVTSEGRHYGTMTFDGRTGDLRKKT